MTEVILTASWLSGNVIDGQSEDKYRIGKNQKNHLSFLTAQKMIKKFLDSDRVIIKEVMAKKFTKLELAERLSIGLLELEGLIKPRIRTFHNRRVSGAISLPLIRLYCETKWIESK